MYLLAFQLRMTMIHTVGIVRNSDKAWLLERQRKASNDGNQRFGNAISESRAVSLF